MRHEIKCGYGRVLLGPLTEKDSELYRQIRNKTENRKWFVYDKCISYEEQNRWYEDYLKRAGDYMFSIYLDNSDFAGALAIYNISSENKTAEFGRILISQKGLGLGVDAVKAALILAERDLHLRQLCLHVYADNEAAIKTYLRAGFTVTERLSDTDGRIMIKMEIRI